MPVNALTESAILTTLLTDGFVVAIALCALAPRDGWGRGGPIVGGDAAPLVAVPEQRSTPMSSPSGTARSGRSSAT